MQHLTNCINIKVRLFPLLFLVISILLCGSSIIQGAESDYTAKLKVEAQKYYWGKGVGQDYSKALDLYVKAAELGDNEAQYIAGGMFYKGYGTPRNLPKAFSFLYGAALEGSSTPDSQKVIGQFFLTGITVPKNYHEAMKWYKMAAESGDREAQSELAFLYFTGRGGERNLKEAFEWYEKSARQGLAVAQYSLGIMFYTGSGIESADIEKAYGWLSLAASQNHTEAIAARNYIETLFSQQELVDAQKYATSLFQSLQK